jgi:hypothetical protein
MVKTKKAKEFLMKKNELYFDPASNAIIDISKLSQLDLENFENNLRVLGFTGHTEFRTFLVECGITKDEISFITLPTLPKSSSNVSKLQTKIAK